MSSHELRPILLAEDNTNDVELTLTVFQRNHIANPAIVVRNGAEALDYLYRQGEFAQRNPGNPAVLLLDLKMPKIDGMEVLRQVKSDARLQNIPVVILTSSREDRDLAKAYELGVNGYVVKPVHFNEFVEAVGTLGLFWAVINELPPESFGERST